MNASNAALAAVLLLAGAVGAQDEILDVPQSLLDRIGSILPERSVAFSPLFIASYSPNFEVTAATEIQMILVGVTAGWQNSVGYFTFQQGANSGVEILDADLLFPDASIPPSRVGASVWLKDSSGARRTFQPGEMVGFFLVADGWNKEADAIRNWTWSSPGIPSSDPSINDRTGRGTFTTIAVINPEILKYDEATAHHVAMVGMPGYPPFLDGDNFYLMGFEDTARGEKLKKRDQDFNDNVFLVHASDPRAIRPSVLEFKTGDTDRDGVRDMDDAFPDDPERAYVTRIPDSGHMVIVFEDLYPLPGDTDFNDAVFAMSFEQVTRADNKLKDLVADFHLVGRGASYDHSFGLHIPGLPGNATGTVQLQRWSSGETEPSSIESRDLAQVVLGAGRRIDQVFRSTRDELPPPDPNINPFANTWPGTTAIEGASARVIITFDDPVNPQRLGALPYDPFLFVTAPDGTHADVHLPGYDSFPDRSPGLPTESGTTAFIDPNGNPWAMVLPVTWQFPLEGVPLARAFPEYEIWRASLGLEAQDWYEHPTTELDKVSAPVSDFVPRRIWPLQPPSRR